MEEKLLCVLIWIMKPLDMDNETFREILLSPYDCSYKLDYFVQKYGELLCVLVFHPPFKTVDMWVMGGAGVWKRKTSIKIGGKYDLLMGFRNNGEMVRRNLNQEFGIVSYDLKMGEPAETMKSKHLEPFRMGI